MAEEVCGVCAAAGGVWAVARGRGPRRAEGHLGSPACGRRDYRDCPRREEGPVMRRSEEAGRRLSSLSPWGSLALLCFNEAASGGGGEPAPTRSRASARHRSRRRPMRHTTPGRRGAQVIELRTLSPRQRTCAPRRSWHPHSRVLARCNPRSLLPVGTPPRSAAYGSGAGDPGCAFEPCGWPATSRPHISRATVSSRSMEAGGRNRLGRRVRRAPGVIHYSRARCGPRGS